MIFLKSDREVDILDSANNMVLAVLDDLKGLVEPGVSTWELDRYAEEAIRKLGGEPAFKGYKGFPASLCASINQEVVHGIPSKTRVLREGDIVGLDLGVRWEGFYGDAAVTVPVGKVGTEKMRLIEVTREALLLGIRQLIPGVSLGRLSSEIQRHVESHGYSVVREFVGHGIGRSPHEEPPVPNYNDGDPDGGLRLKKGMVLAVEPMVNAGTHEVRIGRDGWTAETCDGEPSAHFEYSVAVTDDGPRILGIKVPVEA